MVAVLTCAVVAAGCPRDADDDPAGMREAAPGTEDAPALGQPPTPGAGGEVEPVRFDLVDRNGARIGSVALTEVGEGVSVHVRATGLPPGPRGIHFHETGACDPPDFESAGGHLSPQGRQHGLENPQGPHAGDLPNLQVRQDGVVDTTFTSTLVTLREGELDSLLRHGGTALVIHAERDDQRTDPSGDSGDRIACGVVARGGEPG
jgi:superoxide dismutase, Cu-Zn family